MKCECYEGENERFDLKKIKLNMEIWELICEESVVRVDPLTLWITTEAVQGLKKRGKRW